MYLKNQIDKWSIFHLFGPILIYCGLHFLSTDVDGLSFLNLVDLFFAITAAFLWEFFDHMMYKYLYKSSHKRFFGSILDSRGASPLDFVLGLFGSMVFYFFFEYKEILFKEAIPVLTVSYLYFYLVHKWFDVNNWN